MDTIEHRKVIAVWLAVTLLFSTVLAACASVREMGMETTPTTDAAATATLSALATENAHLATQVATLAIPTPTPTPSLGKLAYVQGGDIWVKVLPDGEPQRLTTDGRNREPRWSSSGQWLAFRKGDYQVWLMSADGDGARSLNEGAAVGAFAWAPADDQLAYVAAAGLQVISADGVAPVTLVSPNLPGHGPGRMGRIAWNPDGEWIAYEWLEQQPDQPFTYQGLWKVSSDGGQQAELYISGVPEKGEAILAGWSLDGQHILFWQGDFLSASLLADGAPLYSLPAGGGEPLKLVDTVLVHDDFIVPAPQGDRLAVTVGSYRATWTNKRVAVVEAGGGELTWLTDESVAAFSPAWSPDEVLLAYVAMPDRGDLVGGEDARLGMMERHIRVVNAQGKPQLQQPTDDPAYRDERPLWSADGSHLLFARTDAEGRASLWLIPAGGGDPRRVVDELSPLPGPAAGWFGYYGHIDWDQLFDWWRGPVVQQVQALISTLPIQTLEPMATYTDTEIGYALDYPAGWHIQAIPGWNVVLTSFDPSGATGQGGVAPEQLKIDLLPDKPAQSRTLDEVVAEVHAQAQEVLREERWELAGGVPAVRMQVKDKAGGEMALLLTVINSRSLRLLGYSDLSRFDVIARTLRPIQSTQAHDLDSARQALMAYLSLLHEQRYSEAINYYGGTYDILRDWNPTVAQDDYATLFKDGCTMNGLKCLSIRTIVCEEEVSPTEFRFTVEFTNDDGSLFVLGPCCGATETEMPPQTQFVYTVKRVEDRFLVQDLPVYVP